jgi:hypothetical protein
MGWVLEALHGPASERSASPFLALAIEAKRTRCTGYDLAAKVIFQSAARAVCPLTQVATQK